MEQRRIPLFAAREFPDDYSLPDENRTLGRYAAKTEPSFANTNIVLSGE
jgi:hypothetical protein